jgi:hypothetical protein
MARRSGSTEVAVRRAVRSGLLGALLASATAVPAQEPVHVRLLPVDLLAEPARYLLRLECGDRSLANVSVGLILPPGAIPGQVDFGGCAQQGGVWNCANAQRLGVTVDKSASSAQMGTGGAEGRTDTLYARLAGTPLCTDGQAVDLAQIAVFNLVPDPAPMLVATSQRVDDQFGGPHAVTSNNAAVSIEEILYETGAGSGPQLIVRPIPVTGQGSPGHRFELVLDSLESFYLLTLGLILPQGVGASQVSFGGCTVPTGGNLFERSCVAGDPDLGFNVLASGSHTLGPAPGLAAQGARSDALYLVLQGARQIGSPKPVLNYAGKRSLLGVISFDVAISADIEDLLPPVTTLGIGGPALQECYDRIGERVPCVDDEIAQASKPPDSEEDGGGADDVDLCPWYDESDRAADADVDGRGNECECTDQNLDGSNTVQDISAINRALFNPALVTALCDGTGEGDCDVNDILAANVEIFSPGHTAICERSPVRE